MKMVKITNASKNSVLLDAEIVPEIGHTLRPLASIVVSEDMVKNHKGAQILASRVPPVLIIEPVGNVTEVAPIDIIPTQPQTPMVETPAENPVKAPAETPTGVLVDTPEEAPAKTPVVETPTETPTETPVVEPVVDAPTETPVVEPVVDAPTETPSELSTQPVPNKNKNKNRNN